LRIAYATQLTVTSKRDKKEIKFTVNNCVINKVYVGVYYILKQEKGKEFFTVEGGEMVINKG
jgi:hypothetical protein